LKEDIDKAEDIARKLSLELQGVPQEEIKTFFRRRLDEIPESLRGLVEPIVSATLIYGIKTGEISMRTTFDYVLLGAACLFMLASVVIAIVFPNPTGFQAGVFRTVSLLTGGAFAGFIPGMLNVTIGNWLKATGALAVFVILYLVNPASFVF
jgi:hypothetical protein